MRKICFLIMALVLSGCQGGSCSLEARYGLVIALFDIATGEPISTRDASYIIQDGEYLEEGNCWDNGNCFETTISGAIERPGVYDIEINNPGYDTWRRESEIVSSDECHVEQIYVEAFLTPNSQLKTPLISLVSNCDAAVNVKITRMSDSLLQSRKTFHF